MFNFSGSEIVFLLLLALIVLGPDKLPDAVRRFGKTYGEFKKMTAGFQSELKSALDEPMREMRQTADAFKKAASFDFDAGSEQKPDATSQPKPVTRMATPSPRDDPAALHEQARPDPPAEASVRAPSTDRVVVPRAASKKPSTSFRRAAARADPAAAPGERAVHDRAVDDRAADDRQSGASPA